MTEKELQDRVQAICSQLGLYHKHDHDSRRSTAGFPDSFIMNMRTGHIMFRELKSSTGQLDSEQRRVGYALRAGGHDWAVWRPAHLTGGLIGQELARLAGHRPRTAPGACYGPQCDHVSHGAAG